MLWQSLMLSTVISAWIIIYSKEKLLSEMEDHDLSKQRQ